MLSLFSASSDNSGQESRCLCASWVLCLLPAPEIKKDFMDYGLLKASAIMGWHPDSITAGDLLLADTVPIRGSVPADEPVPGPSHRTGDTSHESWTGFTAPRLGLCCSSLIPQQIRKRQQNRLGPDEVLSVFPSYPGLTPDFSSY